MKQLPKTFRPSSVRGRSITAFNLFFSIILSFLYAGCNNGSSTLTPGTIADSIKSKQLNNLAVGQPQQQGMTTITINYYLANTATLTKWYADQQNSSCKKITIVPYINTATMQLDMGSYLYGRELIKGIPGTVFDLTNGDSIPAIAMQKTFTFRSSSLSLGNLDLKLKDVQALLGSAPPANGTAIQFIPDIDSTDGKYHLKFNMILVSEGGRPVHDTTIIPPPVTTPLNPSPPSHPGED